MAQRHLPLVDEVQSSLRADGHRQFVYPADVRGRYHVLRHVVFYVLIAVWAALPWIHVGGKPAVFLDMERRSFYLFGATFNAQDIWLLFFLLTGVGFGLVYVTAFLGRVWCGWACPQTVFLDGVFRKIERWVEGPREKRMRRDAGPWTVERVFVKTVTHGLYLVAAFIVAHIFLSYFVSLPQVFQMVRGAPKDHPEAFAWALSLTGIFYFNFSWFREQLCLIVCPYGRLQSVMVDADSLVVGYDARRGEPRGKAKEVGKGDCVDCRRCIVVCPTGIDIRNGSQLDCIGCTACIDACDEIMVKMGRKPGLIRYDSLNGLDGKPKRIVRPRVVAYTGLLLVGAVVASVAWAHRAAFEANMLRLRGTPYVIENGQIRNAFEVHIVNKLSNEATFELQPVPTPGVSFVLPIARVKLASLANTRVPLFATMAQGDFSKDIPLRVRVVTVGEPQREQWATARFLGAKP